MPFIHTKVNCPLPKETEEKIASELGAAISLLPGKSEQWLMLQFEENCRLYFRGGKEEKIAFVNVKVYGDLDAAGCDRLTGRITAVLQGALAISPDHIYIAYEKTDTWGWSGENF